MCNPLVNIRTELNRIERVSNFSLIVWPYSFCVLYVSKNSCVNYDGVAITTGAEMYILDFPLHEVHLLYWDRFQNISHMAWKTISFRTWHSAVLKWWYYTGIVRQHRVSCTNILFLADTFVSISLESRNTNCENKDDMSLCLSQNNCNYTSTSVLNTLEVY